MTAEYQDLSLAVKKMRRQETTDDRLIFAVLFPVFLVAVALMRLLPWNWNCFRSEGNCPSVFAEARRRAELALPHTFLG